MDTMNPNEDTLETQSAILMGTMTPSRQSINSVWIVLGTTIDLQATADNKILETMEPKRRREWIMLRFAVVFP